MDLFLPIYNYYLFVCGLLSPLQWSAVLMMSTTMLIAGIAIATGWGGAGRRWQVVLIRTCGMLLALLTGLFLVTAVLWTLVACAVTVWVYPNQNVVAWWFWTLSFYKLPIGGGIGAGLLSGVVVWFILRRKIQPGIMHVLGLGVVEGDAFSDVRTIKNQLPKPIKYDPRKYFAASRKRNRVFLGIDQFRKIVEIPREIWKKTHVQILGPTGVGKGLMACSCLAQAILYGDAVFVIDPKNDEYAPSVLREVCQRAGKLFHFIDLRRGKPFQIDLLKGISKEDLISLLIAGFSLGERGSDADHFRKNDRKAARHIAGLVDSGPVSFKLLAERAAVVLPEGFADKCEGFLLSLGELSELESVQAPPGSIAVGLDEIINEGGCLYFVGSTDDEAVVVLQKMLLLRIAQLVAARPRDGEQRHVSIFGDESRYMMSKKLGDLLGSIRDKNCNILLAHQSLDDLKTGDVPSPAVVIDNTALRCMYRSTTEEMARWISSQTGTIVVNKSGQKIQKNAAGGQVGPNETYMSQVERQKIDVNMVQNLPNNVAVVVGADEARLAFTSPIPVNEKFDSSKLVQPAVMPNVSDGEPKAVPKSDLKIPVKDDPFPSFLTLEEGE